MRVWVYCVSFAFPNLNGKIPGLSTSCLMSILSLSPITATASLKYNIAVFNQSYMYFLVDVLSCPYEFYY